MMQDKFRNYLRILLVIVVFALCIWLVIIGQKSIGPSGLGIMLIGLAGLLIMLFLYNQRYTK